MTLAMIPCFLAMNNAMAADNAWSVEQLNARKADWDRFLGAQIRVEGRISLSGSGQMRLVKCDLPFHASDSVIRSIQGKKSVEATGRLRKEGGKFYFDAEQIQVVPGDLEQYETRASKFRNPKGSDWYALGDWAAERSHFYDDSDLQKKAVAAYEHGISADRRVLENDDSEGRFQLADKVAELKLPNALRMELMHEAFRLVWTELSKARPADKAELVKLTKKLAEDLPGSTEALPKFSEAVEARYEKEPLAAYRDADDGVRRQLHRIFYASVQTRLILDEAAADGSNGDQIASRLIQQVPEAGQLADRYRQLKLDWRLEHAATATRAEIEQLAADFRGRKQPDQAKVALTEWLAARDSRLRDDGPLGMLQLADEHLALLQDERKAVSILVEANKIDPQFLEVKDRLKTLGYENVGGTWTKSRPDATPAGPAEPTIPSGIAVGMSAVDARNAMGVKPGVLSRALSKNGVVEVWCYGARGTSRVIIRLEGTTLSPELRVVEIRNER